MVLAAVVLAGCAINPNDPLADSVRKTDNGAVADPTRAASLIRVAASTARAGDIATAAALYRRAQAMDPYNPAALVGLGNALSGLGAHEQAAEAYRKALKLRPENTDALHGLGNALIALDQPAAAIDNFEAVLKSKKAITPRTYNGIGVANDMMRDHASAQAFYRTGLKENPGNLSLRNNLGLSLALAGKFTEAIEILRRVASDSRAGARQRLNLALVYGLSGNNAAAAEVARIDLDEPAVRRNLAYYRTLRALNDPKATLNAVGAGGVAPRGFTGRPPSGG
jgi:Flp pilus assembly protein TadD